MEDLLQLTIHSLQCVCRLCHCIYCNLRYLAILSHGDETQTKSYLRSISRHDSYIHKDKAVADYNFRQPSRIVCLFFHKITKRITIDGGPETAMMGTLPRTIEVTCKSVVKSKDHKLILF